MNLETVNRVHESLLLKTNIRSSRKVFANRCFSCSETEELLDHLLLAARIERFMSHSA